MRFFNTLIAALLLAAPALAAPQGYPYQQAPVKTPCSNHPKATYIPQASPDPVVDPIFPVESPEPIVDPIYTPDASPEPVADPMYTPVESPEPNVDPIYTPVESPEPVVDPMQTPCESPEPVVDPIYTPSESPEPVVDLVYPPVESPEPIVDPVYTPAPVETPVYEEPEYTLEPSVPDEGDSSDDTWEKDMNKWSDDEEDDGYKSDDVTYEPVYTPSPVPHKKPVRHEKQVKREKPVKEEKKVSRCYLQSIDFVKYTAEQCCEVHFSCDSPQCAHNYECKNNPDVCHCHKVMCKKIYLLASYKPVDKLRPSCSDDVFPLH